MIPFINTSSINTIGKPLYSSELLPLHERSIKSTEDASRGAAITISTMIQQVRTETVSFFARQGARKRYGGAHTTTSNVAWQKKRPFLSSSLSHSGYMLLLSLIFVPSYAQVVAYKSAVGVPGHLASKTTPTIHQTANGASLIHIAAPNERGISHNRYHQFNVTAQGAILNNSASTVATQLGGYIPGNPHLLAGQHAGLIINEVMSSKASTLNGFIEVAGPRAQVIIANPNGIQVSGGAGFINTPRATLTTGKPIFSSDGELSALRIQQGKININAGGLNAAQLDRLDLLARSVSINDVLLAKELNVITGANQVNYTDLGIKTIQAKGQKPRFSLDSSALGGMYAQRIVLIGTERGVGVNMQGDIIASGEGITLDNKGNIKLQGNTHATGPIQIKSAGAIDHSGARLFSTGHATLTASGRIINDAGTLKAEQLTINAHSMSNKHGKIIQSGKDVLTLAIAKVFNNQSGLITGNGDIRSKAGQMNNTLGQVSAQGKLILDGTGELDNTSGHLYSAKEFDWENYDAYFNNTQGQLIAGGSIFLGIAELNNTFGHISTSAPTDPDFVPDFPASIIIDAEHRTNNTGGVLRSAVGDVHIHTPVLTGVGRLYAGKNASLQLEGDYTITPEHILEVQDRLTITTTGKLTNQGHLFAPGDLSVQARYFSNLNGATMDSKSGLTFINTKEGVYNMGRIYGQNIFIGTPILINDSLLDRTGQPLQAGIIAARENMDIDADIVINKKHAIIKSGAGYVPLKVESEVVSRAEGTSYLSM